MNTQEREHWDHENGRFANEHQAAFALSRIEADLRDMRQKAERLVAAGLYVLVYWRIVFCTFTDASLGCDYRIAFASRDLSRVNAEAERRFGSTEGGDVDCGHGVMTPRKGT